MIKLKTPLIIAGATCIFSMLIGMISGVRFMNILTRGLVAGLGAGGFAFLASFLLERFIPDLFTQPSSPHATEPMDAASGSNVNITLDDEMDTASAAGTSDHTDTGEAAPETTGHHKNDSIEENTDSEMSASDALTDIKDDDFADTPETDPSADQDSSALADLPGMGSFMDDDEALPEDMGSSETASDEIAGNSGFSVNGIETGENDSKVMAQAIRTILATED